jgi:uncharacterized protein
LTTFLLYVNVLIALLDPAHVHHDPAHEWFGAHGHTAWATCPLTENGVLRIVGHARYPNSPGTPSAVLALMAPLRTLPGHVFWPDDISLMDAARIDATRLLSAAQVTDSYLPWPVPMTANWPASTAAWSPTRCAGVGDACM